jgi:DNA-binding CsgD family transcriptional regulator
MENVLTNSGDGPFFKEVISKLCASIFIIDLESMEYIWGNGRYHDMLGYHEEEIFLNIREFAEKYFHPDDKRIVKERLDYFRNPKNKTWSGVYRIKHKEGYWVWVYSKIMVFKYDELGKPQQLIGLVLDAFENFKTIKRISKYFKERIKTNNIATISKLTHREIEIICLISVGKTYKEIAEKLHIQPDTVNKHRKNILDKLELNNVASLVNFANETGLV